MLRSTSTSKKSFSRLLLCAAALTSFGVAGCADEQADQDGEATSDEELQELASVQAPSGVRFASVTANGTGCPRGSWRAVVSPNGETISLRFSSFEGEVGQRRPVVVKDCTLGIRLNSNDSVQYALVQAKATGYASLREGTSAVVTTKAYWQGNPADSIDAELALRGQYKDEFSLGEPIPERARSWSPCGVQRNLNIATRSRLAGTDGSGGYLEVSKLADIKIAVRKCGAATDGGTEPDGSVPPDASVQPGPDGGVDAGPDGSVEPPDADVPDTGTPDAEVPDTGVPPSGLTITSVTANGTGCPPGSTTATISPDGQNFALAFSQFTATVDPSSAVSIKDCNLAIAVANPAGQAFALETLNLGGTTALEAGLNAVVSSNFYFQGAPNIADNQTTTLTGPSSGPLVYQHVGGSDAVYSTCGVERNLNGVLRVRLQNGTPRASGTVNVTSAGPVTFSLRPCATN